MYYLLNYLVLDTPVAVHEQDIRWLKDNNSPESDVTKKWTDTFEHREQCRDVKTYFALFKCLQSTFGHILVKLILYIVNEIYLL